MRYTTNKKKEISFPVGGIGTGSIGIGGDGRFIDWEIFNKSNKGSLNGYSSIAIRAIEDKKITAFVLNGDIQKDLMGQYSKGFYIGYGFGPDRRKMAGFPHFKNIEFNGEFPVASLDFKDENFPANVNLLAFNPFIPRDSKNSSIPAGFFEVEVENTANKDIIYQLAFTVMNPYSKSINKVNICNGNKAITFYNDGAGKDDIEYGDLTIATDCDTTYTQTYWYRGGWNDSVISFWDAFSCERNIKDRIYDTPGKEDTGTLIAEVKVGANEKKKVRFVLSWNVPNCYNYWNEYKNEDGTHKTWKNYYATVFENSLESAQYSLKNWNDLYNRTMKFKEALHGTTLPEELIDAVSSNLSVLKSPTVLRLEDGSFYGWEGVQELEGSCEGTCQHVWNYAYAMCFLFPDLERSIRDMEFKYSTAEDGRMGFRVQLPLGREMTDFRACVDGQMGAVIKCYREWKISGNNEWLKSSWDNIKKVLEYAWSDRNEDAWDRDKDGVLEGRQHHTLDKELFGPSSWLQGIYLLALKCASEMAEFLGEKDKAQEYCDIFCEGCKWTKENLFNGKYFIQKIDLKDKEIIDRFDATEEYWNYETNQIKYQIADGSEIDQLLGQWHADILGVGDIFDGEQINTTLDSMMKNNFKPSMRYFFNSWRLFCVDDEAGTIICDFPEDVEKPHIPIPYFGETMTGFEYSFAGLLISRGKLEEGFKVVKAIRDRYDGEKRNPWNEFECGSNYARSMASYALIPILSGFEFDMPNNHIGFKPYKMDDFSAVWSLEDAWGNFRISNKISKLNIYEGSLVLKSFGAKYLETVSTVIIDGKAVNYEFKNGVLYFDKVTVTEYMEIK